MIKLIKVLTKASGHCLSIFSWVFLIFSVIYFSLFMPTAHASGEFASSYRINYDVAEDGLATVTEEISLRNLTDRYYASNFKLEIAATQIAEVAASDRQGPLQVSSTAEGKKTLIEVDFNRQIAGKGKQYKFRLQFKSRDFAQAEGRVWQVTIPKITAVEPSDDYSLDLSVPVSFGDPATLSPDPVKQVEENGKVVYSFSKDQVLENGITANFGLFQIYRFEGYYLLGNSSLFTKSMEVALPPDSQYQQVAVDSISPKPENTYVDRDGNFIARFKVGRNQTVPVAISGLAKIFAGKRYTKSLSQEEQRWYTAPQKYWEKDNPQILSRLGEIFKGADLRTNREKAELIYKYVVSYLTYDQLRVTKNDYLRLGALAALNNPTQALCQEFSDLFVALARAAGLPARELVGYADTRNQDIRPLSLQYGNTLHAWPEFYDPDSGWVMVDPTWENTTGGVDYFSKFDLDHLVFDVRGSSSVFPLVPVSVKVKVAAEDFRPQPRVRLSMSGPDQIFAGIPNSMTVKIENLGNIAVDSARFAIESNNLDMTTSSGSAASFVTPVIPPRGFLEYNFDLKSKSLTNKAEDTIKVSWGNQTDKKRIIITPFLTFKNVPLGVGVVIGVLALIYLLVLFAHLGVHKRLAYYAKHP